MFDLSQVPGRFGDFVRDGRMPWNWDRNQDFATNIQGWREARKNRRDRSTPAAPTVVPPATFSSGPVLPFAQFLAGQTRDLYPQFADQITYDKTPDGKLPWQDTGG